MPRPLGLADGEDLDLDQAVDYIGGMNKTVKITLGVVGLVFVGICVYMFAGRFRAHYPTYSDTPEGARSWHVFGESAMLESTKLWINADVENSTFEFSFSYPKEKLDALVDSIPVKVSAREEIDCSGLFKSLKCYKYEMKSAKVVKITVARKEALSYEEEISYWLLDPETGNVAGWSK